MKKGIAVFLALVIFCGAFALAENAGASLEDELLAAGRAVFGTDADAPWESGLKNLIAEYEKTLLRYELAVSEDGTAFSALLYTSECEEPIDVSGYLIPEGYTVEQVAERNAWLYAVPLLTEHFEKITVHTLPYMALSGDQWFFRDLAMAPAGENGILYIEIPYPTRELPIGTDGLAVRIPAFLEEREHCEDPEEAPFCVACYSGGEETGIKEICVTVWHKGEGDLLTQVEDVLREEDMDYILDTVVINGIPCVKGVTDDEDLGFQIAYFFEGTDTVDILHFTFRDTLTANAERAISQTVSRK